MPSGSSQHMREEQKIRGETKGESWFQGEAKPSLDGGKHPSEYKWLNLSILANFMLALIANFKSGLDPHMIIDLEK